MSSEPEESVATFAAGCFWGVEKVFRRQFSPEDGLLDVKVGYTGGNVKKPVYEQVYKDDTGHLEAIQIRFVPSRLPYNRLVELFFRMHEPTTASRQGNDQGYRYSSAIFVHNDTQREDAESVLKKVEEAKWWEEEPIVTRIIDAGEWWDAEDYHQKYLVKNPQGYECATHFVRKFPPIDLSN